MIGPAEIRLELEGALERPAGQLLVPAPTCARPSGSRPGQLLELRERPTRCRRPQEATQRWVF